MKKLLKRLLVLVLIAALIGGSIYGVQRWRGSHAAVISVYEVIEVAETDYWEDQSESYGTVTTDRVQAVFLSTTQKVEEVKVQEGQQVKKGDVLMTYDTTLSQVEVQRAQLEIQKLQQEMKKYQSDLEKVKNYRPGVPVSEKNQVEVEGYTPTDLPGSSDDDMRIPLPGVLKYALAANGSAGVAAAVMQVMSAKGEGESKEDKKARKELNKFQKLMDALKEQNSKGEVKDPQVLDITLDSKDALKDAEKAFDKLSDAALALLKEDEKSLGKKDKTTKELLKEAREIYDKLVEESEAAAEASRLAEEEAAAEASRLAEEEAAAEASRQAEEEAAAEASRQAEEEAAAEASRLAEEEAAAEASRLAEEEAAAEASRQAEEEAAAEASRQAEEEAAAEASRLAEEEAAAEASRMAEEEAAAEASHLAEEEAAAEASRLAEEEAAAEASRLAEEEAAAEASRLAEEEAAAEALQIAEEEAALESEKESAAEAVIPEKSEEESPSESAGTETSAEETPAAETPAEENPAEETQPAETSAAGEEAGAAGVAGAAGLLMTSEEQTAELLEEVEPVNYADADGGETTTAAENDGETTTAAEGGEGETTTAAEGGGEETTTAAEGGEGETTTAAESGEGETTTAAESGNGETTTAAEDSEGETTAAQETTASPYSAADVSRMIGTIQGSMDQVAQSVQQARAAYDSLSPEEQAKVKNADILAAAERAVQAMRTDVTETETTTAAETTVAQTIAEETRAAETTVAQTTAEETIAAETTVAQTTAAETSAAETTAAQTTAEETTAAETTAAETTAAETTAEETTAEETTAEETTAEETTAEGTTAEETTAEETTAGEEPSEEPESPETENPLFPPLEGGNGSQEKPYEYHWYYGQVFDQPMLAYLSQGKDDAYVTLQVIEGREANEHVSAFWTVHIFLEDNEDLYGGGQNVSASDSGESLVAVEHADDLDYASRSQYTFELHKIGIGEQSFQFTEPDTGSDETTEESTEESTEFYDDGWDDGWGDDGTSVTYTAAEIADMRNTLEESIRDLDLDIRQAELDYQKKQKELNNGAVMSEIDGVVRTVRDAETAQMENQALIEVSGGGGYIISGSVSELELGTVAVGQSVEIMSYDTGQTYQGEITEISSYPQTGNNYYGSGNTNVSYYPFKVFVDESASLQNGEFVQLQYEAADKDGDSFYLMNSMIRSENGKSFVYVRGKDGLLKKQTVKTGKTIWGSYTEILNGLSIDSWIAFPYGKDVKEGCQTKESTSDELWSYE